MQIPQRLDDVYRMTPEDQREAGEILGRLLAAGPEALAGVTKIRPDELQGLLQGASGAPSQPEAPGATIAPTKPQPPAYPADRHATAQSVRKSTGTYGVLSDLAAEPKGLVIRDTKTGASRPAVPGDALGPTEVMMSGHEILRAGLRAQANLRLLSQQRV